MSKLVYLSISGVILLLIVGAILYLALKPDANTQKIKKPTEASKPKKAASLDQLIQIAKTSGKKSQLSDAIMAFVKSEVLPAKTGNNLSEDAKKKLSFISLVCANKASDAKMISFLICELEKRYPEYAQELDLHQNLGLAKRRMSK